MRKVRSRKQDMVDREIEFHLAAYKGSGAELIMGNGRFVGPKTVEAALTDGGTRQLAGNEVVVNVGTHAAIPDIPGLEAARALTHIEALELDYLPSHMLVLGGGYIGIEMAQAYRCFGSRVTIIGPGRQLKGRKDADVAEQIQAVLVSEGIQVLLGARPVNVHGLSRDEISATVRTAAGEQRLEGSDLLVAVGRIANTDDIALDKAGVALDARGFVQVNERLETTAPGVWDIGEEGLRCMSRPPRRYAHFLFAAMPSALISSIAAAIASFNLIRVGGFLGHWLRSWAVAWIFDASGGDRGGTSDFAPVGRTGLTPKVRSRPGVPG